MLSQNYDPKKYEELIYTLWQVNQVGLPEKQEEVLELLDDLSDNLGNDSNHCILMPPPNLTGLMHAGHSFQHFLMDTLSRINRQKGSINLWFPGVDHAGLQLEGVIDKMIKKGEFDKEIKSYFAEKLKKTIS
jgi:valyl-tRNA synthetase